MPAEMFIGPEYTSCSCQRGSRNVRQVKLHCLTSRKPVVTDERKSNFGGKKNLLIYKLQTAVVCTGGHIWSCYYVIYVHQRWSVDTDWSLTTIQEYFNDGIYVNSKDEIMFDKIWLLWPFIHQQKLPINVAVFFTLTVQKKITSTWSYRHTGLRHSVQQEYLRNVKYGTSSTCVLFLHLRCSTTRQLLRNSCVSLYAAGGFGLTVK